MNRKEARPNPISYRATLFHTGFEYQRSFNYRSCIGIIAGVLIFANTFIIRHHVFDEEQTFVFFPAAMLACGGIADYIFYRFTRHK